MMRGVINAPPPSLELSLTSCTGASKSPSVPDPKTLLYYSPPPPPIPPSSYIPSPPVDNAVPPSSPTIPPSVPIVSPPDYQQSVVTPVPPPDQTPPPAFSPPPPSPSFPPPPPLLSSPDPYANPPYVNSPSVLLPPPPIVESPPPPSLPPPIAHIYQSPPPPPLPPAAPTVSYASPPPPAVPTVSYASPPPPAVPTVSYASPPPPTVPTVSYASPPPLVFSPPPPYRSSPPKWPSPPFRSVPPPVRRKSPPSLPAATRPPPFHELQSNIPQESITGTVATLAVVAGLVMLTFAGAIVWFVKKQKRPIDVVGRGIDGVIGDTPAAASSYASGATNPGSMSNPPVRYQYPYSPSEPGGLGNTRSWFTLEDLSVITNDFSDQNLLGEGGFGCVYKGQLSNGREVAVKQLKVGGSQGEREFKAEVETISRVHHRHLVSLVGYCITENQRLLVYDYVPNKTLHYHLHGQGMPVLTWSMRVKIAAGAARGIAYLHEDCHPRIIHRDIKSSNILLDNNFDAQVSDFGLARSAVDSNTHVTTRVMGTFGYLAPEYASSGKLTAKSDVYSFGVVLLELITGRRPVDTSQPLGEESVVEWARPILMQALETGDLGDLPDAKLEGNYARDEVFHMMEVAAACVRHSSYMRPRMGQVVRALASFGETDINNGVRPGHSQVFSESQQSEEIRRFQRTRFDDYSSDQSRSNWISRSDL